MKRDLKDKSYNQVMNEWAAQKEFLKRSQSSMFLPGHGGSSILTWLARLAVLVILPLAVYGVLLRKHLRSESFGKELESQIALWLDSPKLKTKSVAMDLDGELRIQEISGDGGPKAPFARLKAEKITTSTRFKSLFGKAWHLRNISAFALTTHLRSGAASSIPVIPPKKTAQLSTATTPLLSAGLGVSPDFRQLSFDRFSTGNLNLTWGTGPATAGHLTHSVIIAQRSANGFDVLARGGDFGQGWLDGLRIGESTLSIANDRAVISKADFSIPSGGTGTFTGSVSFGEYPEIAAEASLTAVSLSAFLPKPLADSLPVICDGSVTLSGSTNRVEGITAKANLTAKSGVLQSLPILHALEIITGEQRFAQPAVTGGTVRFSSGGSSTTGGYEIDTTGTVIECGSTLRVKVNAKYERILQTPAFQDMRNNQPPPEPKIIISHSGRISIGVSPEAAATMRPSVRDTHFAVGEAGMFWLDIPISGDGPDFTKLAASTLLELHNVRDR